MLRLAHLSDLHIPSPLGAEWREMLFNKRITGYANLVLRRGRVHRRDYLDRVLAEVRQRADHIVLTGDLTNLALDSEFAAARAICNELSPPAEVTVVPGNHDLYLPSVHHERRFPRHFSAFMQSDLPELAVDLPVGSFPFVKLRGPAAIIGLSSAVPRPPFIAAGYLGHAQLEALARVLEHPEVMRRLPVIAIHHPPVDSRPRFRQLRDGLVDGAALRKVLQPLSRGLVLFGHLHGRTRSMLPTASGALDVVSATGAALDHFDPAVRAGFNLYEIDDSGAVRKIEAYMLDAEARELVPVEITRGTR